MTAQEPNRLEQPATASLMQLITAYRVSQALHTAVRLNIFEALADGSKTAAALAAASGAHAPSLHRLLRALTTVDVLAEDAEGQFHATALGERMRANHPESLRAASLLLCGPVFWQVWGHLSDAVRTGRPAFDQIHGEPLFDFFGHHPEEGAIFDEAMVATSRLTQPAVLKAYDFSPFRRVVDIGGGRGALLRAILEHYPSLRGVLADQPAVVAQAVELRPFPEAARCEFVEIDMFVSVPAGGDAYILQRILHDWNDAECVQILRNCRTAIAPGGKLLVIDAVLQPPNRPDYGKWTDLNMLVLLTGRERTAEEFRALFAEGGFMLRNIFPAGIVSVVEGIPV